MPAIPNFPPELMAEHRNWHRARHQVDTNNPPPGYGRDFLQFHRQYIAKVRPWYLQQGYDPSYTQPWTLPPEPIRQSPCYNLAAEQRITMNPRSFASADELGWFIESSGLHNCIHQQSALYYNEPALNNLDIAPGSTVFYQIHGMIDRWYSEWEAATGMSTTPAQRAVRRPGRRGGARNSRAGLRSASTKRSQPPGKRPLSLSSAPRGSRGPKATQVKGRPGPRRRHGAR